MPTKKPRNAFIQFFSSLDRGEADAKVKPIDPSSDIHRSF